LPAGALQAGDLLRTRGGQSVPVEGVADSGEVTTVYNWRIADYHTYYVSATEEGCSVWAHNAAAKYSHTGEQESDLFSGVEDPGAIQNDRLGNRLALWKAYKARMGLANEPPDVRREAMRRWVAATSGELGGVSGGYKSGYADWDRNVSGAGQIHHAISNPIHDALENHPTLARVYQARDPRFVTTGVDLAAHNGYQQWHSALDQEVVTWLKGNQTATPAAFQGFLKWRYSQPDLMQRFPNGVTGL
jgi:hypothetical protein